MECQIVDEFTCVETLGGNWLGEGTDCGTYDEETGWSNCQSPLTGACCQFNGMECSNGFTEEDCVEGVGGTWMGEGSDCGTFDGQKWSGCDFVPPTGACCINNGTECINDITEEDCIEGYMGTWKGQGSECGERDPESGIYNGCRNVPPPTGACCINDGTECIDDITEEDCIDGYMGTWKGEGTDCTDADENNIADICEEPDTYDYLPGDANMINGQWPPKIIGADVTYLVGYFRGINGPCLVGGFFNAGDANGDCRIIGSDVTRLVSYFRGLSDIAHCADYPPAWLVPEDCPTEAPDGWPNCEVAR
jgi:hypothetical protein